MQAANMILRVLEIYQLISNTLLDEHAAGVLIDYGLLVLRETLA